MVATRVAPTGFRLLHCRCILSKRAPSVALGGPAGVRLLPRRLPERFTEVQAQVEALLAGTDEEAVALRLALVEGFRAVGGVPGARALARRSGLTGPNLVGAGAAGSGNRAGNSGSRPGRQRFTPDSAARPFHDDSDRDYWLRADEAKEYGLIDEVLTR